MCTIPLVLNGMIGARLHVPYPVAARSGFGWYFSRFAIVVRMITASFWHAIQTYTGSTAMTQIIRAIWPSYLDIPNHLPESAGVGSIFFLHSPQHSVPTSFDDDLIANSGQFINNMI